MSESAHITLAVVVGAVLTVVLLVLYVCLVVVPQVRAAIERIEDDSAQQPDDQARGRRESA